MYLSLHVPEPIALLSERRQHRARAEELIPDSSGHEEEEDVLPMMTLVPPICQNRQDGCGEAEKNAEAVERRIMLKNLLFSCFQLKGKRKVPSFGGLSLASFLKVATRVRESSVEEGGEETRKKKKTRLGLGGSVTRATG